MTASLVRVNPDFEDEWPGSSATATEIVLNVVRTGEALGARVDAMARAAGLPSVTAMIVLEVLRGAGEPLHPATVAERCFLSRPALSSVMDTLERRGHLVRRIHVEDRRRVLVSITEEGRTVLEALLPELHRAEASWVAGLTEADRHRLLGLLDHLQGRIAEP